jgi:tetratricopeptide (TPR) repeat protein
MTTLTLRHFAALSLLAVMTGCSVSPTYDSRAPVEDRGEQQPPAQTQAEPAPKEQAPAQPPAVATPLPEDSPSATPAPSPAPAPAQQSPAVVALLDSAEQARAQGDYRAAQGSLQRAQRIAPRDPAVYYSLAQTHMQQENFDLAEQVALKGVSLAQNNPYQSQRLWKLIAKIRLRAGDPGGAKQAEQKAARY